MAAVRVGVVRGGAGPDYDFSLRTGAFVLANLKESYLGEDVFVSREGVWHWRGLPVLPRGLKLRLDVFFNALHGQSFVSGFSDASRLPSLPLVGSRPLAAAVSLQGTLAKKILRGYGVRTLFELLIEKEPESLLSVETEKWVVEVHRRLSPPWLVRPATGHLSVQARPAGDFRSLRQVIRDCLERFDSALAESTVPGCEVAVGVIDNFREQETYVLPAVEASSSVCPGRFRPEDRDTLGRLARLVHRVLGLRDYSCIYFLVSPRGIYFLKAESTPVLSPVSPLVLALQAVGSSAAGFLDHVLSAALGRRSPL